MDQSQSPTNLFLQVFVCKQTQFITKYLLLIHDILIVYSGLLLAWLIINAICLQKLHISDVKCMTNRLSN